MMFDTIFFFFFFLLSFDTDLVENIRLDYAVYF